MTYRLTYFPFGGRAAPIRIAFFLVDVPFEDRKIPFSEFPALRSSGALPLDCMPILEVDGYTFTQSTSMLRFVAALRPTAGLYPSDPLKALVVDSTMETMNDTLGAALTPSMKASDPEEKQRLRAEFVANAFPKCLRYVDGLLGKFDGPFLTGSELTIADILLGQNALWYASGQLDGVTPEVMAPYKRVAAFAKDYAAHPRIAAYQAKHQAKQ